MTMPEDPLDECWFGDRGDDTHLPATVRTDSEVDIECPGQATADSRVSDTTLMRLIRANRLPVEQVAPMRRLRSGLMIVLEKLLKKG